MFTTCLPHVHHACVYHMFTVCSPHVYHVFATCSPHVYHVFATCSPHVYHVFVQSRAYQSDLFGEHMAVRIPIPSSRRHCAPDDATNDQSMPYHEQRTGAATAPLPHPRASTSA